MALDNRSRNREMSRSSEMENGYALPTIVAHSVSALKIFLRAASSGTGFSTFFFHFRRDPRGHVRRRHQPLLALHHQEPPQPVRGRRSGRQDRQQRVKKQRQY